ncbi:MULTISPECIES: class II fructose-bisphosphate aldolase [Clostridium]|uniref:class II fructose-bisphosphate aldolase n=1 Tax=Clostridium TaxID=1485 RepID=UPI000826ABF2|nr:MULTISPECIES: class II fructose-bisphosphate aldolase [Clostridium]PJI08413.1 ketose-bisphosphate aldolase [Clostridium sp. CT7]
MLVSGNELLEDAFKNNYAIPAFNFNNMENVQAIIDGAEELNSPVIIQTTEGAINYAGFEYIADIGIGAARRARVPVALHLDHGQKFQYEVKAIRLGWTSLMIDASREEFDANVERVKEVVKVAKPLGISVEAEIGKVGGKEDDIDFDSSVYTTVDEAKRFYDEVLCDSLAVAVGTQHGIYKGEVVLNFDRIKEIKNALKIPIVLHGSSGVPLNLLKEAVQSGINKVNFDTDLKLANHKALKSFIENNPDVYDTRKIYNSCREAMKETVKEKIMTCMSNNRSWL